jgi:hypothetical protein
MAKQSDKQEWMYTEDGPELQKNVKPPSIKVSRWLFIAPWVIWFVTIVYLFWLGGNWAAMGFLLIVFGPVPITLLNIKTFKKLYLKPINTKK